MASFVTTTQFYRITRSKRKFVDDFVAQHFRSRSIGYKKLRRSIIEDEEQFEHLINAAVACCFPKERKPKGPIEERNSQWWDNGYCNWTNNQFKKRLRVSRETFDGILESMRGLLLKETIGSPETRVFILVVLARVNMSHWFNIMTRLASFYRK